MAATPDEIKTAFQNAIPHRRADFARRVSQRLRAIVHEDQYVARYPADVLSMAADELRARIKLAADRVKQLIDSGWTADQMITVRKAFLDCFGLFDRMDKDPQSDLHYAVEAAFDQVGQHNPPQATMNARRLSQVQVDTATEFLSDLELYYSVKHPTVPARTPEAEAEDAKVVRESVLQWESDAFICHASEDKPFVRDLAARLKGFGVRVWLDETELTVGDGLVGKIDAALKGSQFGIVILSRPFFSKEWPKLELEGLVSIQTSSGRKVILPVWHGIGADEIRSYSPVLAGHMATKSRDGMDKVVSELLRVLRPDVATDLTEAAPAAVNQSYSFREQIIQYVKDARALVFKYGLKPTAKEQEEILVTYIEMAGKRYHAIRRHLENKLGYKRVEVLAKLPMPMTIQAILHAVDVLETLTMDVPDHLPAYPPELEEMT